MDQIPVSQLKNIGATLSKRLARIGVFTSFDLKEIGSARAYQRMSEQAGKNLPVCYNLYSLEAALDGVDWRELPSDKKEALKKAVLA